MDFDLTKEQTERLNNVRHFLEKEIAPVVETRDRQGPFTRDEARDYIKQLMPFGYYIGALPETYGGQGLSATTRCLLNEELSRVWSGLAATLFIAEIAPNAMINLSESVRQRLLPKVIAGDLIGCGGITEPDVGSDAANIQTTAELKDDMFVVNGNKTWISNATIADICMLIAVTDKTKGPLGISSILVEKAVSPWKQRELHKLGWLTFPTGELFFDHCRVPKENLIGDPSAGYQELMNRFETARCTMATMAVGISRAAIDASVDYARRRKQFGRPIGSFQMIQELIADMIAEKDASRLLAYRALDMIDKGVRARKESSLVKAYACEAAVKVADKALQIHGAAGLSEDSPVQRYYRDARMLTIPDGATQIQKLIVGREAVGLKAFN